MNPQWVHLSRLGRVFVMTQMNTPSLCDPDLNSNCMLLCLSKQCCVELITARQTQFTSKSRQARGPFVTICQFISWISRGTGQQHFCFHNQGAVDKGQIFYFSLFLHSCVNPVIWGQFWHPEEAFSSNVHIFLQHLNYPSTDFFLIY